MPCRRARCALPALDVPRPLKNPRRWTLQVSIKDTNPAFGDAHFREGQFGCAHRFMLLVESRVVLPAFALCLLTRFRRERLLGET
jgi:hypothetical protein